MTSTSFATTELGRVFREESGRVVAALIRRFGDVELAEDAVQEAFAIAADRWPRSGLPANPAGWITTTARNRAIDRLRRESKRDRVQAAAVAGESREVHVGEAHLVPDDELRLIFLCCHPALARHAQVALTLRLFGGLQIGEIRPRVPGVRVRGSSASRPGEAQDPGRAYSLPHPGRCGAAGPAAVGDGCAVPSVQRGPHCDDW